MFAPVFGAVSERHPDIAFGKVDTETEADPASVHRIISIPTLMVVRDGALVCRRPGALAEPQLELLLSKARDLNMDGIRRHLAGSPSS